MQQRTKRLLLSFVGGGLGVLLLVVGLRSATSLVLAEDAAFASGFQAEIQPVEPSLDTVPQIVSNWQRVMLDSYDGTFTGTHSIPRAIARTGSAPYEWGRTITGTLGFTNTLWSVQGGEGSALHAGIDTYTNGVTTTVTYGPIDLRYAITTAIAFSHWISVADGDGLEWGYSTDGTSFTFIEVPAVTAGTWQTTTVYSDVSADLAQLNGQPNAYLAFRFHSNDDDRVGLGVFLNDVQLWARYHAEAYLPFMARAIEPYEDDFSDPTSGWPREWKRNVGGENNRGGYMVDRSRAQVLSELMQQAGPQALDAEFQTWFLGLDDDVYYSVVHDAWDRVFISGPYQAEGDFSFEARGRYDYVQKSHPGNRYGILVTREPVDPRDPHSVHGYCIYVEINPKSDGGFNTAGWGIKEWYRTNWKGDDDGDEDRSAGGPGTDGIIKSGRGSWNTFRIERHGDELSFFVNGKYFGHADNTYTGPLYIGLFARHTGSGSTELSYDVLFEWDDVLVTPIR
jgi:hypothetical protein